MFSLVFILIDDIHRDMTRKDICYDVKKWLTSTTSDLTKVVNSSAFNHSTDKLPFLLNILIQFLYELMFIIVRNEKKILENILPNIAAYEETRDAIARDLSQIAIFQFTTVSTPKKNKNCSDYSFSSSETNNTLTEHDTLTINKLKLKGRVNE